MIKDILVGVFLALIFSFFCSLLILLYYNETISHEVGWKMRGHMKAQGELLSTMLPGDFRETTNNSSHARECSSPETAPWAFEGCAEHASSRTSPLTCGFCDTNKFAKTFLQLKQELYKKKHECSHLVVYGVAFGEEHIASLTMSAPSRTIDGQYLINWHNRCFFTFVLREELPPREKYGPEFPTSSDGLDILVPISKNDLPYSNMRRNTKLLKLHGHLLFPWTERLIWQDAKFRRDSFEPNRPTNYFRLFSDTIEKHKVCVSLMGIPIHSNTFGEEHVLNPSYRGDFMHHCETILDARAKRPRVTDSSNAIRTQCAKYLHDFQHPSLTLSDGLVDSAMILWDQRNDRCKNFNADLSCTWSDELHCHSDRDQVSFPYALMSMRVQGQPNAQPANWHSIFHDEENKPVVQIIKSRCHWYFAPLNPCLAEPEPGEYQHNPILDQ